MPDLIQSAGSVAKGLDFNALTAKRVRWTAWEFTVVAPFTVEVTNASYGYLKDEHSYRVSVDADGLPVDCDCPGFQHHHGPKGMAGKHMVALATVAGPVVIEAARNFPAGTEEPDALVPDGGVAAVPPHEPEECKNGNPGCPGPDADDLPCFPCFCESEARR